MHKAICAALAAVSLLAISGCKQATMGNAASDNASENAAAPAGAATIDGTWKTDMSSLKLDAKPDVLLLKAGQFSCSTCTPPLEVAADGAMHAVTGRPYADHISIKVDDDHHVSRTSQKDGKTTGTAKYSVSSDGNTLTVDFNDMTGSKPVTGSYTETRDGSCAGRSSCRVRIMEAGELQQGLRRGADGDVQDGQRHVAHDEPHRSKL